MSRVYRVEVAGLARDLPVIQIARARAPHEYVFVRSSEKDASIALVAEQHECCVIITTETKSVPLAYEIASLLNLPYVVLRKSYLSYMGDALETRAKSITTGAPRSIYLDAKDRALCARKPVAIVDDVISTGSTLAAMRELMQRAGARIVAEAAVFTEGDAEKWKGVVALGHLPVFSGSAP